VSGGLVGLDGVFGWEVGRGREGRKGLEGGKGIYHAFVEEAFLLEGFAEVAPEFVVVGHAARGVGVDGG